MAFKFPYEVSLVLSVVQGIKKPSKLAVVESGLATLTTALTAIKSLRNQIPP